MSTLDRRAVLRLFGGLAAAGVTGAVAGCTTSTAVSPNVALPNGKQVTIGLIAPAVGPYMAVGADITRGFQVYLEEHLGLLGLYTVDLKVVDEGASVADATKAAKDLFSQGVLAVAGIANPAALAAIVPQAVTAKIPVLSANAAPATVSAVDFIWRVSCVQGEAGEAAATFARSEGRRAFVLSDGSPVADAEVGGFTAAFSALGGQIAGTSEGTDGFAARLNQVVSANADVIFASHTGDSAAALLTAFQSSDVRAKMVGPGTLTESIDLTKLNPIPEHVFTSMFYAPDLDNAENQRFVAGFHNKYGVAPSSVAAAAYDVAGLLDRALRLLQGDVDGVKLNDAMKILGQINSPRGSWAFNTSHSPQQTWYLRELRFDGQVASNLHDSDLAVLS